MREYSSGTWGLHLVWGLHASVFPRAFAWALPNAVIAWVLAYYYNVSDSDYRLADEAFSLLAGFTTIMSFVLGFRSNIAYRRWWEGGTLLQQTRGEWFNAYSSLIAFSSLDPGKEKEVEAYQHMLVRFMSLLFCSALQQVSPDKEAAFEIIKLDGIDPESIRFLRQTSDQVEVVLQWIQRSTILNAASGVLTAPPPILSRAFQEISRGIVNLQNARKIADFPFPFPYAQTSIVMLLIHWAMCPFLACMLVKEGPFAALICFVLIFFLWSVNYIAFDLENPFGTEPNDLPMAQFQADWNKSLVTLLAKRAQQPPAFEFDGSASGHRSMQVSMSDGCCARKKRMSMSEHIQGNIGFGSEGSTLETDEGTNGEAGGAPGSGPQDPSKKDDGRNSANQAGPDNSSPSRPGGAAPGDGRPEGDGAQMATCPFPSHVAKFSDPSSKAEDPSTGARTSTTRRSGGEQDGATQTERNSKPENRQSAVSSDLNNIEVDAPIFVMQSKGIRVARPSAGVVGAPGATASEAAGSVAAPSSTSQLNGPSSDQAIDKQQTASC